MTSLSVPGFPGIRPLPPRVDSSAPGSFPCAPPRRAAAAPLRETAREGRGDNAREAETERHRGTRVHAVPIPFPPESQGKGIAGPLPLEEGERRPPVFVAPESELPPEEAGIVTVLVDPLPKQRIREIVRISDPLFLPEGVLDHHGDDPRTLVGGEVPEIELPGRESLRADPVPVEVDLRLGRVSDKAREIRQGVADEIRVDPVDLRHAHPAEVQAVPRVAGGCEEIPRNEPPQILPPVPGQAGQ